MDWRSGVLAAPRGISLNSSKAAYGALAAHRRGGSLDWLWWENEDGLNLLSVARPPPLQEARRLCVPASRRGCSFVDALRHYMRSRGPINTPGSV
jgi:hypothetical protein